MENGSGEPASSSEVPVHGTFALVVPDLPALVKQFVYSIPDKLRGRIEVGTQVRVDVQGRRVGGWVVEMLDQPPEGLALRPIAAVRGIGPPENVLDIAKWASWRWAGAVTFGLRTASSDRVVSTLRAARPVSSMLPARPPLPGGVQAIASEAFKRNGAEHAAGGGPAAGDVPGVVVRIGPSADRLGLLFAASDFLWGDPAEGAARVDHAEGAARVDDSDLTGSGVLVIAPTHAQAEGAASRLKRAGYPVALLPGDWAMARAGQCVVVGTMAAAYAPLRKVLVAVVLDAHDEAFYAEAAPTWCAWEVVAERARRDGAPLALVSPCPTLDLLHGRRLVVTSRHDERQAWPRVEVVDRRQDDPRTGLFSDRVVRLVRWAAEVNVTTDTSSAVERRVVCVLNRKGRARLLVCGSCKAVARCERCSGPLSQVQIPSLSPGIESLPSESLPSESLPSESSPTGSLPDLVCRRCGLGRPHVCAECGSVRLLALRPGVSRVREELEVLAGTPVAEVSGSAPRRPAAGRPPDTGAKTGQAEAEFLDARVVVGTEAVLHRVERADAVVFLDFDQELMAPRMRAGEEALALLARAARLVSRSSRSEMRPPGGPLVVQTRIPDHPVIDSAVHADPSILERNELEIRTTLGLPPVTALARITGAAADSYGAALSASAADGIKVVGPHDGEWRVVAEDHESLCDLLASVPRPAGRLRVEVDPVRA